MTLTKTKGDQRIEAWIDSHGTTAELKSLPLMTINKERSLHNQSRFVPLNDDTVVTYASAMERGDVFPPIVVYKDRTGYVVIDGNHRFAAKEMQNANTVDAYVVENASELQIQTMTFESNAKHGLPSSHEERLQHALFLVELGVTQVDAAAMVNVPLQSVKNAYEAARADRRLGELGIERWNTIQKHSRRRLYSIRNDNVAQAASRLVVESKMNTGDINDMVTAINKETTEAAQMAVVDTLRQRHQAVIASTAGGRIAMPISMTRVSRSLAYTEGVDPAELRLAAKVLTPDQRTLLAGRINRAMLVLMETKRVLEAAD
jgi:ParB-like chromosome segregation protein Spo0J